LNLYEEIQSKSTINGFALEIKDDLQILEGICDALSRYCRSSGGESTNYGVAWFARLVQPVGSRLAHSLSETTATTTKMVVADIQRLTTIIQHLKLPIPQQPSTSLHPVVELLRSLWSILDSATTRFAISFDVAEKFCRLHKHSLRTCGKLFFSPLLPSLLEQITRSYEHTHQSPYLYLMSILVTEYGADVSYSSLLYPTVARMIDITFSFLPNVDEYTKHPDVLEELFYLLGRVMNHYPAPMVTSALLSLAIKSAAMALQVTHQGVNEATLQFIDGTVSYGLSLSDRNNPEQEMMTGALEQAVATEGQEMVFNIVRILIGDLPISPRARYRLPEILWKFHRLFPALFLHYLSTALEKTASFLSPRMKDELLGALDEGLSFDEFSLAAHAFENACSRERHFIPRSDSRPPLLSQ
jgi:transportin-3